MNRKTTDTAAEYLARGKNTGVLPDSTEFTENEGYIPSPFRGDADLSQDQNMERLDEALRSAGGEVISNDDPGDGDADDPGQA